MCDSKNRAEIYRKKSSLGRPCVPYSAEVHESVTTAKEFSSKRRRMSSRVSPTYSMWDSMNRPTMARRNSLHEGRVGIHKESYYTKSKASVAITRSIGAIRARGDKCSYLLGLNHIKK